MESKKTKLTISGGPKSLLKALTVSIIKEKTVIINKQQSKFSGKSKIFKGGYKSSSTSLKGASYKANLKTSNSNLGISDLKNVS